MGDRPTELRPKAMLKDLAVSAFQRLFPYPLAWKVAAFRRILDKKIPPSRAQGLPPLEVPHKTGNFVSRDLLRLLHENYYPFAVTLRPHPCPSP